MKLRLCALPALLLTSVFLSACAAAPAMHASEHSEHASMQSALATTVYHPNADGSVTPEEKRLPWEANMGNYALSFVFEDGSPQFDCRTEGTTMVADIQNLPAQGDAAFEQAVVASIVNTLCALPGIEQVTLTFDGERIAALRHGTPVSGMLTPVPLEPTPTAAPKP